MSRTNKSPYASSFTNSIKKGWTTSQAVCAISKRTGKSTNTIFASLKNAGLCKGQRFNGTWTYWPATNVKVRTSKSSAKSCANMIKQSFIDWCLSTGHCTTKSLTGKGINPAAFSSYCRNLFNSKTNTVWSNGTSSSSNKSTSSRKAGRKWSTSARKWTNKNRKTRRTSTTSRSTWGSRSKSWSRTAPRTYKFSTYINRGTSSNSRRYRKVA